MDSIRFVEDTLTTAGRGTPRRLVHLGAILTTMVWSLESAINWFSQLLLNLFGTKELYSSVDNIHWTYDLSLDLFFPYTW